MLLIVTDLESNKDKFRDPVLERLHDLKYEFDSQVTGLGKMFNRSLKMELGSI